MALEFWIAFPLNFDERFYFFYDLLNNNFLDINFCIGVDEMSLVFLLLSSLFVPFCLLSLNPLLILRIELFYSLLFLLEGLLFYLFSCLDIFYFFIFFEATLIPMFLIIGFWGSRSRKIRAAYQFFIYTLFGSIFLFFGLLNIFIFLGSFDFLVLNFCFFDFCDQVFLWLCFFISFAVKVPMFPIHTWLPEAHTEAPTVGSVLLAAILLKLGGYGFIRFSFKFFPLASFYFIPWVLLFCVLGILYTSLTTIRQLDLKKIIAYSSVGHMGFVIVGCFSCFNYLGLEGSLFLMIGHGLVSGSLFFIIGFLYDRLKTRSLLYFGGFIHVIPLFAFFFLFFFFRI